MEPVPQIRDSKGVAFLTRDEIDTDSRKEKAERHHDPGPYPRTFADIGGERQPEANERGFLDRAEGKGGRGKGRPEKGDREGGDYPGNEAGKGGDSECPAGATGLGHRIAIEAADHAGCFAGHPHEDRGGRAAIKRAIVDARQQDDGAGRVEHDGDRQEHADRGGRAEPGNDADGRTQNSAEKGEKELRWLQRDRQAAHQISKRFRHPTSNRPAGSGTPSNCRNTIQDSAASTAAIASAWDQRNRSMPRNTDRKSTRPNSSH